MGEVYGFSGRVYTLSDLVEGPFFHSKVGPWHHCVVCKRETWQTVNGCCCNCRKVSEETEGDDG